MQPIALEINLKILENMLSLARQHKTTVIFTTGAYEKLEGPFKALIDQYVDMVSFVPANQALERLLVIRQIKKEDILNVTNHYNSLGNKMYAEAILLFLFQQKWGHPPRVFEFDQGLRVLKRVDKSL